MTGVGEQRDTTPRPRAASSAADPDAELRREFRRFVRDHHPDRGGDPEVFAAGVRAFREGRHPFRAAVEAEQVILMHRSPRGLGHVTRWARRRWESWTRPPRVQ